MSESFRMLCGDALDVLRTLPDEGANCCVTSPPYWGLRNYGMENQIGLEATPEQYVARLVDVFRELRRVLRNDGTLWLNLGDCYATGAGEVGNCPGGGEQGERWAGYRGTRDGSPKHSAAAIGPMVQPNRMPIPGLKPKDLVGIPWRVAFALQADGWWLRSEIIWSKPNPMPESVTDRPTKAHEQIFLLTKNERYHYDADAIAEPCGGFNGSSFTTGKTHDARHHLAAVGKGERTEPTRRNKRSVWTIATLPTPDAHFATFPIDLAQTCILAGTPAEGLVIDPFAGAGTTGLAALKHGRRFLGIELNQEYISIAENRVARHCPLLASA